MNHKLNKIMIGSFIAVIFLSACSQTRTDLVPVESQTETPTITQIQTQAQTEQVTTQETQAQLPVYHYNEKTFVNLETEQREKFIPEGYEVILWQNSIDFPEYLLLKKGSSLFRYTAKTHTIDPIKIRAIANDERMRVNASANDKTQFLISFNKGVPVDGMYDFAIESTTRFYYDAKKNSASDASDTLEIQDNYMACHEYDSKFQRILYWPCGEGVGNIGPVTAFDIKSQKVTPYITNKDLGIDENETFNVYFAHGTLNFTTDVNVAVKNKTPMRFIFTDLLEREPQLTTITANTDMIIKNDNYPYGILWIKEKNLLAIGFSDHVSVIKLNQANEAMDATDFEDKSSYINEVYSSGNKLYYKNGKGALRVINLESLELEKTIPMLPEDGQGDGISLVH